jgi:hypothetical protein
MPDASISLGINEGTMFSDLKNAEQKFAAGMDRMGQSTNRLTGSHENLLRSNHRVAAQIHTVTRDFLSGASGADVFGTALEGVGRSLNISLGTLAGLAIGAVAFQQISKAREEAEKLHREIAAITSVSSGDVRFQTLESLNHQLDESKKKLEELKEKVTGVSFKRFFEYLGSAHLLGGSGWDEQLAQEERDKAGLKGKASEALSGQADKLREKTRIGGMSNFDAQRAQALSEFREAFNKSLDSEGGGSLGEALGEAFAAKLASITQQQQNKMKERSGMTVGELAAATPEVVGNDVPYEKWKASQDAREAQRLDAAGESARAAGNPGAAHNLFNQSGAIKDSLSDYLKPSERMNADLKGELVLSNGYLKTIAENLTLKGKP